MPPELTPTTLHHQPVSVHIPTNYNPNNNNGDEETSGWYIPRPALCRGDNTMCSCSGGGQSSVREWLSPPPSSNTSTQSGSSGSLLLTAANLAALRLEPVSTAKDADATSLASSTHFTMINYPGCVKEKRQSICARHHVSAIVLSMSAIFLLGLLAAVYYMDMRSYSVRYSR
uniref:Unkown protein n=1 Tax=Riptortus pedestris TaxID=329032 RepID=R4WPZ2_RIPPE|nr:unkown protein [Riptortus pedestris]